MATKDEVTQFLKDFKYKLDFFHIIFRDDHKAEFKMNYPFKI